MIVREQVSEYGLKYHHHSLLTSSLLHISSPLQFQENVYTEAIFFSTKHQQQRLHFLLQYHKQHVFIIHFFLHLHFWERCIEWLFLPLFPIPLALLPFFTLKLFPGRPIYMHFTALFYIFLPPWHFTVKFPIPPNLNKRQMNPTKTFVTFMH